MRLNIIALVVVEKFLQVCCQCADELQGCAVITEEYESEIQNIKAAAFAECFANPTCNYEKQLFQECFIRSVRAIRAPFNNEDSGSDSFGDSAQRYRGAVDQCFIKSNVKRSGHFDASAIFLDG
ncbi:unnamed protein product [Dracunculus medinensis]|uniref:RGM_N domain-containing protein n=1 Tax=Dracunculus medinensis TaxID=318479 RepID=A0A0N4UGU5_DRAME|nr:unnamed protein product [Dracunculus medinensis]